MSESFGSECFASSFTGASKDNNEGAGTGAKLYGALIAPVNASRGLRFEGKTRGMTLSGIEWGDARTPEAPDSALGRKKDFSTSSVTQG